MSNTGFMQFGFGQNDDDIGRKSKKFKAEGGRTYQVSFAWWKGIEAGKPNLDESTPSFVGAQRHFHPQVGFFLNKGPEWTRLAGEPPKMAIATVIIVWPTTPKGEIDRTALANGDFEVKPWIFSQDKYDAIRPMHAEWHLGQHDLKIVCTDTQYQKMTFTPCGVSLFRKLLENEKTQETAKKLIGEVQAVVAEIQNEIARDLTLDQIREKLGNAPASPTGASAVAAVDVDSVIDGLIDK